MSSKRRSTDAYLVEAFSVFSFFFSSSSFSGYSAGVGQGATFGFEVPVEMSGGEKSEEISRVVSVKEAEKKKEISGKFAARVFRVLCVDDSKILLSVVSKQVAKVFAEVGKVRFQIFLFLV
jgi:hypothetical protein